MKKISFTLFFVLVAFFMAGMFASVIASIDLLAGYCVGVALFSLSLFRISKMKFSDFSKRSLSNFAFNTIGTVAAGIGTPTSFNGVKGIPGALCFEISTTPQQITININGRVNIVLLDTAGINNLCNPRSNGRPATSFFLPISNGLQTDYTMDITVINNVATAFDLIALSSDSAPVDAPGFYVSSRQTVNAGSIQIFDDFTYLALPNMVAADQLTVLGGKKDSRGNRVQGNFTSRLELQALRALISQRENAVSGLVPAKVALDNYNNDYQQLNFQPNATQIVYVQRLVGADFRGLEVFS